ncbi:MAG: methyltransferase domain-containing protein [Cyclobacteriaceae bacterium]
MSKYIHGSEPEEQQRLSLMNELINARCLQLLQLKGNEKILDVGSGLGQFSIEMARIARNGICVGIERDERQFELAQQHKTKSGVDNVAFRLGTVEEMPLAAEEWGHFDVGHARFILEHLSEPGIAIDAMVKAVRPGGHVVVEDDDHYSFLLYPEPHGFSALWTAYMRSYDRLGNDPYIGRRLVALLYDHGLTQIQNNVVFFGDCAGSPTFQAYIDNLIGILNSAKKVMTEGQLIRKEVFEVAMDHLKAWAALPHAALWYTIYWAKGTKPE